MTDESKQVHTPLDPDRLFSELDAKIAENHNLDRARIRAAYEMIRQSAFFTDILLS